MRQTLAMSIAVLALISNVNAVSLNKEVTATNDYDGFIRKQTEDFQKGWELKREFDDNDNSHEAEKRKADKAAKKAFDEAEWKRKFNPFDGQVHEDDGKSWNLGDKIEVRGVNNNKSLSQKPKQMMNDSILQAAEGVDVADRNQMEEENKIFARNELIRKQKAHQSRMIAQREANDKKFHQSIN